MLSLITALLGTGVCVIGAKLALMGIWFGSLMYLFRSRKEPKVINAFVSSLAVILIELLFVLNVPISVPVLIFFLAMAKVILAVSYLRVCEPERFASAKRMFTRLAAKDMGDHHVPDVEEKFSRVILSLVISGVIYSQVMLLL